jgi:hypothetical protein
VQWIVQWSICYLQSSLFCFVALAEPLDDLIPVCIVRKKEKERKKRRKTKS